MAERYKNLALVLSGNILEYFDLSLYVAFSSIIAKTFMPHQDDLAQLFSTFTILAATFLARPLGSLIFGYIGDGWGRSKALTYSILGMSLATFLIGTLPTYNQIGITAPIILIVCRILQGICVGGEGQGAAVYALERFKDIKPGLLGAGITATNVFGALMASVTAILLTSYTTIETTWRYPFLIAGILGISSAYFRSYLIESYQGRASDEAPHPHSAIYEVFKQHWRALIITFLLGGIASALSQTVISFFNLFFVASKNFSASSALSINIFGILIYLVSLFVGGIYADHTGIMKSFRQFLWCSVMLLPLCFLGLTSNNTFILYLSVIGVAFVTGCVGAPIYRIVTSLFPVSVRYTGVCFGFNLGIALLGGTFPMIISSCMVVTNSIVIASSYLVVLSLLCLFFIHRYKISKMNFN